MNGTQLKTALQTTALASALALLTCCSATSTLIEHRKLETNTNLSETLFLDHVSASQKTVFVSVKNTSQESLSIDKPLKQALIEHGYKVVSNPEQAHYLLQANILRVGKMSSSASQSALSSGFGSTLMGAGTGVALGALTGNSNAMIGGGLAGGVIGIAADSLVMVEC